MASTWDARVFVCYQECGENSVGHAEFAWKKANRRLLASARYHCLRNHLSQAGRFVFVMARSISCRLHSCTMAQADLFARLPRPLTAGLTRLSGMENDFILNTSATAWRFARV